MNLELGRSLLGSTMHDPDCSQIMLDAIDLACRCPRMVCCAKTLAAVDAFLRGIEYTVGRLFPDGDATGMSHFKYWIAARYAHLCDGNYALWWTTYLRAAFAEETEQLAQLPGLYRISLQDRERLDHETGEYRA